MLNEVNLLGATFKQANLTNARLISSCLIGTDFTEAILDGTKLCHSDLTCANLLVKSLNKETDLTNTEHSGLRYDVAMVARTSLLSRDLDRAVQLRQSKLDAQQRNSKQLQER
jgi:uncharacterized protein YjbI with pentapeptide repeats